MLIRAKFIGKNSLGYRNGEYYDIILRRRSMIITRKDGTGQCPYQSLRAFLINWTDIETLNKDINY